MEISGKIDEYATRSIHTLLAGWERAVAGTSLLQPPRYQGPDVTIRRFVEDSRQVESGDCFVARLRRRHDGEIYSDGRPYIPQAVARGAGLVLLAETAIPDRTPLPPPEDAGAPLITIPEEGLAWLAAAWYGFPAQQLVMVGVTGTDGKTTIISLLHEILKAAGLQVGMISTIKAVIGEQESETGLHVTTPEAPAVQRYLRQMVEAGMTHCLLETTSHGWAQYRTGAISFDVGVVSNIKHEHLDYHGSFEGYFAAKARLFESLNMPPLNLSQAEHKAAFPKAAILNRDDSSYEGLRAIAGRKVYDYGLVSGNVYAEGIEYGPAATTFSLMLGRRLYRYPPGKAIPPAPPRPWPITSHLVGEFNLYNLLAAAAAAYALDVQPAAIQAGIAAVRQISGRMERIDRGQTFMVVVDFAHTPAALKSVLDAARAMTNGPIIVVLGSAGKRDVEKRRLMAEVAARQADLTVFTAEDPRGESLADILAMMVAGAESEGGVEGQSFWRIPDRGRAIYFGLKLAGEREGEDPLVLICGKGHEQSMNFDGTEYPWDDREATHAALDAYLKGELMVDLGLPTF